MSKKNKRKNRSHKEGAPRPHQAGHPSAVHAARPRRFTPIKVGIGLGIVMLGGALLLGPALRGRDNGALSGRAAGTTQPVAASAMPVVASLPPPAPGTRVPLNDVDPVTGKSLTASSPTLNYKGYVIGFCCEKSSGYKGDWARMSDNDKDAFVRKYLK